MLRRSKKVYLEGAGGAEEEQEGLSRREQEVMRRSKRVSLEGSRRCRGGARGYR